MEVPSVSLEDRAFEVLGGDFSLKLSSWYKSTNVVWKVLLGLPGPCTVKSLLLVPQSLECLGVPLQGAACSAGSCHPEPSGLDRSSSAHTALGHLTSPEFLEDSQGFKCPENPNLKGLCSCKDFSHCLVGLRVGLSQFFGLLLCLALSPQQHWVGRM